MVHKKRTVYAQKLSMTFIEFSRKATLNTHLGLVSKLLFRPLDFGKDSNMYCPGVLSISPSVQLVYWKFVSYGPLRLQNVFIILH